jgi:uncharacterized protein
MAIYCIHHSADLDGHCSGAIVRLYEPRTKLIGMDYGQKLDLLQFHKNDDVYMVDFSLPHPQMIELSNRCNLIWVDHHKSSLKINLKEFNGLALISDLKHAACHTIFNYFFYLDSNFIPSWAVYLIDRYDVWDFTDPNVLPFQYGMRSIYHNADAEIWKDLLRSKNDIVEKLIEKGKNIIDFVTIQDEKLCKSSAFELEFEGYKWVVLNMPNGSTTTFDSIKDEYDNMMFYSFDGIKWKFSLRSTAIDVSKIAEKFGGGGHPGAAGFSTTDILFKEGKLYVR